MSKETIATLTARIEELSERVAQLEASPTRSNKERDYGPRSDKPLTERMALRILIGRYRDTPVRKIADECGLSRGQVYSLRGRYTFKSVWKTAEKIEARRLERHLAS